MSHLLDNLGGAKWEPTFISGEGALVWDVGGRTYWDFYGGHAVTLIGLGHPRWVHAITEQAAELSFFTAVGDVPVRGRAATKLCDFTGMDRCFFVNSGAEANEAALKVARKATGRGTIVAMENGFHGRTMGALGATWKYRNQHAPAHGEVRFVPFGDLEAVRAALDATVAAVITEPVQGMAGVVMPPDGWLEGVVHAAHEVGALVIADEVQSGIGRMGAPLASHLFGITPDIATVGKGVGGGFPVAAMLCTDAVAATVLPGEHGTTFGGAPMACAAVEATLDILVDQDLLVKADSVFAEVEAQLGSVPGVVDVRGAGAWVAVVLDRPAGPVAAGLRRAGILVGTSTDPAVLRLAPPAVVPVVAIRMLADALAYELAAPAIEGAA